ncbi:O-antigen ligase family protein [Methylomonas methanica]|uniref:O-antigen polymerase n=1 Tax=Methylomonas methanica (strain DSM 25384 / MC09) TaxID=857087 RepID=G0A5I3_METMM|nr:O-antigen ligase family protein [Methylomonas methanica]AEG01689.1 O-antigen polymerase [Methylomonas methanica MC09]
MSFILKLLAIILIMILVSLSLNYGLIPNLIAYDDKRVSELLIIVVALFWSLLGGVKAGSLKSIWNIEIRYLVVFILFLAGLSAVLSASPRHAFLEISVFVGLFYLSLLIAKAWYDYQNTLMVSIVSAISLGAVLYMIGFYTGYLASFLEGIPLVWPEPFFMLSNVRQFNQYQLWTLGLLCLPLLVPGSVKPKYKVWVFCLLSAWWVLLFASTSRGVLLAWLLSMVITWRVYRRLAWPFLQLQLKCFGCGFVAYQLLFVWLPKLNAGGGSVVVQTVLRGDTNDRIYLWTHAWKMIQAHPWLGVGPMHYAWYPNNMAAHPHNSLVQLACEWGLPATGLILFLLGFGLFRWLKRFNANTLKAVPESEQVLAMALFFTAVASAFYSLVDGVIVMPLSQVMMAVVLGMMIGLYRQSDPFALVKPLNDIGHRVFSGVILVVMVWSVLPELLPNILGDFEMIPIGYQVVGPRFWQEGGIPH